MEKRLKLTIGICSLDKKARSKPMRQILDRLLSRNDFEIVIFGDKVIIDEPVCNWPICDFLISFFSKGFPLQKAIEYFELRKPFCVNDLYLQRLLLDRRLVLLTLDAIDVPTPNRLIVSRDNGPEIHIDMKRRIGKDFGVDLFVNLQQEKDAEITENDIIKVGNKQMKKPFVEKPVNSEDHNIYIYYPNGGVRKLFRKIGNKSSKYFTDISEIRKTGAYIYEEFQYVDNAEDVKVYTIGPYYTHAETRKSPVVDGIVMRNADGKEVRYITKLSEEEQEIARRVCMAFGQTICGFDILRVNGKSYVIDVNGWSFVKGSDNYYDTCARILRETFLRVIRKRKVKLLVEPVFESRWKLKKYISVLRHADRTPKQKVKIRIENGYYLKEFIPNGKEITIRNNTALEKILNLVKDLIKLKCKDERKLELFRDLLADRLIHTDTKLQLKPVFSGGVIDTTTEIFNLLVVIKWGGEFTHSARHHSKELGESLRQELFIINKMLLDDIKLYSSSELRVIATSELFSKALMSIAELPIEFIKVNKEMLDSNMNAKKELDQIKYQLQKIILSEDLPKDFPNIKVISDELNNPMAFLKKIRNLLTYHHNIMKENIQLLKNPPLDDYTSPANLKFHNIPENYHSTEEFLQYYKWCCLDSPYLWSKRWEKLFHDFCDCDLSKFESAKISELYDSLKYDCIHNKDYLEYMFTSYNNPKKSKESLNELFNSSKLFHDFISPMEYGITNDNKLKIGRQICEVLLNNITKDLCDSKDIYIPPSTRLYFTKESHVYSLLNYILLKFGENKFGPKTDELPEIYELDYLTQISFEVYERKAKKRGTNFIDPLSNQASQVQEPEFAIRISLSPGAYNPSVIDLHLDNTHSISVAPRSWISGYIKLNDAIEMLSVQKPL